MDTYGPIPHKTPPLVQTARTSRLHLDHRCAKICAINLMLRNLSGDVYCGNSLTAEMTTLWMVRNGFIEEEEKPEAPDKIKTMAKENNRRLEAA